MFVGGWVDAMAAKTARNHLPTPALVIDVDLLDRNIATMTARAKAMGVKLRPHAKAHKCVEIAQRLARAGAVGASCATIGEAEGMALSHCDPTVNLHPAFHVVRGEEVVDLWPIRARY